MYKTFALAILLLPTLAHAQEAKPASAPVPLTTPQIVAKGKLPNQTAPIPTTTIFTPTQTGLYRLSVYATVLNSGVTGSQWSFDLAWTDDQGQQNIPSLLWSYDLYAPGQFWQGQNATVSSSPVPVGGPATVFEAKGGTSITYSVTLTGENDGTVYSLYYTLERLE